MIDTHAHLNYPPLDEDTEGVLARAAAAGVNRIIVPGTSRETSESAVALANQYPSIWAGVGIHPSDAHETGNADVDRIRALTLNPRVVALGEVGLDYFHFTDLEESEIEAHKAMQKGLLREMIAVAKEANKPLIIHSRDCFDDLYDILKADAAGWPTVIHCFTGTVENAAAWLDLGFHLSFTGILTYKTAGELREVAKTVPWERTMIETDAPFLAPQAFRGESCEPAMVREVVILLAELRGTSIEEVDERTTSTAESFFTLP